MQLWLPQILFLTQHNIYIFMMCNVIFFLKLIFDPIADINELSSKIINVDIIENMMTTSGTKFHLT